MKATFEFMNQEKTRYEVTSDIYILANDNTEYNDKFYYELTIVSNLTGEEFEVKFSLQNNIESRKDFFVEFGEKIAEDLYVKHGVTLHEIENTCEEEDCVGEECWTAVWVKTYTMTGSKL